MSASNSGVMINLMDVKLRRERDELAREKQAAEEAALAKSGEIAIVRANQSKIEKIFESKIQAIQKLRQEESARQQLEVERILAEKQKIATEKGFLQNDIAEGNQQIKSLQRAVKAKGGAVTEVINEASRRTILPTTPKKKKSAGLGDGFDDHEIQPLSPSKLPYRSKPTTPKAGSKRKRKPVGASPVKPLQLSQANEALESMTIDSDSAGQSFNNNTGAYNAPSLVTTRPSQAFSDDRFDVRDGCSRFNEKLLITRSSRNIL